MGQDAITLTPVASQVQDILDAIEDIVAHYRFVTAGVDASFVDYEARVIGVSQYPMQSAIRDRTDLRPSWCGP